jgi:3-hydroxy acid dehydrogenase / malonic semialdehyde reductase
MSKIVFITGATSGFGRAAAHQFAKAGYKLIINGRRTERLETLRKELEDSYQSSVQTLVFDVRQESNVNDAIASLPNDWKGIDILVNNAGLALGRDFFEEGNSDDWNIMIDTNVKGFLYVAKAVAKLMVQKENYDVCRGHIINLGSVAGKDVYEKGNVYCGTKFAVDAISKSMRIDLLRHHIKVTAIHPGAAETEFSIVRFKGDVETAKSVYNGITPLSADDVANTIFWCATQPPNVCINDLTLTCIRQADGIFFNRNNS